MISRIFDLIMHEYGTPLSELREWTASQVTLFLKRMTERYEQQAKASKRTPGRREMTEDDLLRTGLMKG